MCHLSFLTISPIASFAIRHDRRRHLLGVEIALAARGLDAAQRFCLNRDLQLDQHAVTRQGFIPA